jgi:hypothetical protein
VAIGLVLPPAFGGVAHAQDPEPAASLAGAADGQSGDTATGAAAGGVEPAVPAADTDTEPGTAGAGTAGAEPGAGDTSDPQPGTATIPDPDPALEDLVDWEDGTTVGPLLDPSASDVIADRIVAMTWPGVTPRAVRTQARSAAKAGAPSATRLIGDPADSPVVTLATTAEAAPDVIAAMVDSGLYQAVDYDKQRYTMDTVTPNDPYFSSDPEVFYGLTSGAGGSHFDEAWAAATDLEGTTDSVTMGWLDSGYGLDHPDIGDNIVAGWDYGDDDADVAPPGPSQEDDHGTQTLSVAAARADNGIGGLGGAWNNRVIAYKVETDGRGIATSLVSRAIVGATDDGANIINLSLGSPDSSSVEWSAVRYAYERDVVVVASSGNSGDEVFEGAGFNPVMYPAAYPEAISVGATDDQGEHAAFSTHNAEVELAAAGATVFVASESYGLSDCGVEGYCAADGTSFSAPLVAAAAALVMREKPGLSPMQVRAILAETATDVTADPAGPGRDNYTGHGIVNARAALERARSVQTHPTIAADVTDVTVAAGQTVSVALTANGYPAPAVTPAPGAQLPAGLALSGSGANWTLSGTPTVVGTYSVALVATAGGRNEPLTVTVRVQPGPAASYAMTLPKKMRNTTTLAPGLTAVDAYGNAVAPAATFVYSINPACRFKKGAKPSYRRCTVQATTPLGIVAQGVIEVYDISKFTKPKVKGVVKPGRKLKASIPAGWKNLTYRWYKNGKAIKGATGRTYKIPKKTSAKASFKVKVTVPGLASKTSKAVKIRK